MDANFPACLRQVLRFEGLFSNNPRDPGGPTMHGITLETYREYKGNPNLTVEELQAMTMPEIATIYKNEYWTPMHCGALLSGLDLAVFNFAVNAGTKHCTRTLQSILGVPQDGIMGAETVQTANDTDNIINKFLDATEAYYRGLPGYNTFGHGWLTRTEYVRQLAHGM